MLAQNVEGSVSVGKKEMGQWWFKKRLVVAGKEKAKCYMLGLCAEDMLLLSCRGLDSFLLCEKGGEWSLSGCRREDRLVLGQKKGWVSVRLERRKWAGARLEKNRCFSIG